MSNNEREIELRFPLHNPQEVIEFLNNNAIITNKGLAQKDSYFNPAHKDFLGVKYPFQWLRIRETPKGCSLDYKHFHPENVEKTDYCDEFQSRVENANTIRKILTMLDFKESVVVDKTRSTWLFKDVEIAIDNVKSLGIFMELEAKKDFENPKQAKAYLYEILKELNAKVGEEDIRGYPFKIIEKQKTSG